MVKLISEYIGYVAIIVSAIFGIYRFMQPLWHQYIRQKKVLSVSNIEHINDVANRALYKAHNLSTFVGLAQYVCRPSGECIYASRPLCKIFNLSEAEMLGYGWTLAIVDADRNDAYENWVECVKNKKPYTDTYRVNSPSGVVTIWTSTEICFEYDPERKMHTEKILFYIGTAKIVEGSN